MEEPGLRSVTFNLFFKGMVPGKYRLRWGRDAGDGMADSIAYVESAVINIESPVDENPPEVSRVTIDGKVVFPYDSIFSIYFSEPVEKDVLIPEGIEIRDKDSVEYRVIGSWESDFAFQVNLNDLKWNNEYIINMDPERIQDRAGNKAADSVIQFKFATYDEDSLGSVSGTIHIDSAGDLSGVPVLIFKSAAGSEKFMQSFPNNVFQMSLPPGKYFLSGFLDRNHNGRHDHGILFPFDFAETYAAYADTIRVRARFETADIQFDFR